MSFTPATTTAQDALAAKVTGKAQFVGDFAVNCETFTPNTTCTCITGVDIPPEELRDYPLGFALHTDVSSLQTGLASDPHRLHLIATEHFFPTDAPVDPNIIRPPFLALTQDPNLHRGITSLGFPPLETEADPTSQWNLQGSVADRISINFSAPARGLPLEPRATYVYASGPDAVVVIDNGQARGFPSRLVQDFSRYFGIPFDQRQCFVGGAFGPKNGTWETCVALCAYGLFRNLKTAVMVTTPAHKCTEGPVKSFELDKSEHRGIIFTDHARPIEARIVDAYLRYSPYRLGVPVRVDEQIISGMPPNGAVRSNGADAAIAAIEIMIQNSARNSSLDPLEYRLQILDPDCPGYSRMSALIKTTRELRARMVQDKSQDQLDPTSVVQVTANGISYFESGLGFMDYSQAMDVEIDDQETIIVHLDYCDFGQNVLSGLQALIAGHLQCRPDEVVIKNDRPQQLGSKPTGGSSMIVSTDILVRDFIRKLKLPDSVRPVEFLLEQARLGHTTHRHQINCPLQTRSHFNWESTGLMSTIAEVQIDTDTGKIALGKVIIIIDIGKVLDSDRVIQQVHGGFLQAFANATMAAPLSIPPNGRKQALLHSMPRICDAPQSIAVVFLNTHSPDVIASASEMSATTGYQVIWDAVDQVCRQLRGHGIGADTTFPLTMERTYFLLNPTRS